MLASESFELHESFDTAWCIKPISELAGNRMLIDAESVHFSELHAVREAAKDHSLDCAICGRGSVLAALDITIIRDRCTHHYATVI